MIYRNSKIDSMRVLGTFLVILAHTGAPVFLQNMRTFDVVMLVFISGMSYAISHNTKESLLEYVKKRVVKLLFPTYAMLGVIFVLSYIVCIALGREQIFSLNTIVHSVFFLNDGIGYIWIVRVYILIAFFCYFTIKVINSDTKYCNVYITLMFIVFFVWMFFTPIIYGKNVFVDSYLVEVIPYCFIAFFGMYLIQKKQGKNILFILFLVLFIILQMSMFISKDIGFCPNAFKYPPKLYYISYGMCISCLVYTFLPNKSNKIIVWFSKNSFWIYLIHILFLFAINVVSEVLIFNFLNIWWIKYVVIMVGSSVTCLIINYFRRKMP